MAQGAVSSKDPARGSSDAAFSAAAAHHRAGRRTEAEQVCREILARNPGYGPALHLSGLIAYEAGNPKAAAELLRRAVATDGKNAIYQATLGDTHLAMGDLDAAEACYRRALIEDPRSYAANNSLGLVMRARGELQPAVILFREALLIRPDFAVIWCNLADALFSLGQIDDAIE